MEENLIGYLLDALDEGTRQQVESDLQQQPEAREKLAALQHALAPLLDLRESPAPPPQLAERTLAKIAALQSHDPSRLPQAPPLSPMALPGGRPWWRRADVLVAACLLFTISGIGAMLLGSLRGPSSAYLVADCRDNLRLFFTALHQYHDLHKCFPDISQEQPHDVAGMFVPILLDAGTLPASASIRCPGIGAPLSCQLTLQALRTMNEAEFVQRSPCLSMCYAYSLGYRDEQGDLHMAGTDPETSLSQLPLMADRPPSEGILSNSVNHGGSGQNVLFSDGHVQFLPQRTFGDGDDIFLNRERKIAAGVDAGDVVLGFSAARP